MPDHEEIYRNHVHMYEQLIASQPSLLSVIEDIVPVRGLDVIDMGAGSGRLTTVLAPHVRSILALDAAGPMLERNAERLREAGYSNFQMQVADHQHIPAAADSADLVVAGWTIAYAVHAEIPDGVENLARIMAEIRRVLRPGGTVIIFETMGTGHTTPHPPAILTPYYHQLVDTYGFAHRVIRLDYNFQHIEEAERLTRFFFGNDVADRVVREHLVQLPECAGIWWWTDTP